MPQSLAQIYLHIVFATKHRAPAFKDMALREEVFRYLAAICDKHECPPIIVGGYVDHVHVVCRLSRKITLETLLRELKVDSSKWIKTRDPALSDFHWQGGYAAFAVSPSHLNALVEYVRNQEEHHSSESFQDELRRLLGKYDLQYDERYLWD